MKLKILSRYKTFPFTYIKPSGKTGSKNQGFTVPTWSGKETHNEPFGGNCCVNQVIKYNWVINIYEIISVLKLGRLYLLIALDLRTGAVCKVVNL